MRRILSVSFALAAVAVSPLNAQDTPYRDLRLDVTEVTRPDVAAFPDGSLLFTLLGHLYRLPAEGGEAIQLTDGPHFHKEPAVAPDGRTIAVVSDRNVEAGDNVHLLDADGTNARQLTDEIEAGRPAWSPDGRRIAFLAFRTTRPHEDFFPAPPARVREVDLGSGAVRDINDDFEDVRDVTYGPDGGLIWLRFRPDGTCRSCGDTEVLRADPAGGGKVVATLSGRVQQLRVTGAGVFYWGVEGDYYTEEGDPQPRILYARASLEASPDGTTDTTSQALFHADIRVPGDVAPRFAVVPGAGLNAYLGDWGQLWEIRTEPGDRRLIPFRARAAQTVRVSAEPPPWSPPEDTESMTPTAVGDPVLSPDGQEVAFTALGTIWYRRLGEPEEPPRRLDDEWATAPTYSPDGRRVAYLRRLRDFLVPTAEVVVADGWEGRPTVVATGAFRTLAWSPDGGTLITSAGADPVTIPASGGTPVQLELGAGNLVGPQFTRDGTSVVARRPGPRLEDLDILRIPLDTLEEAVPLTEIENQMKSARVSGDGRWLAFRRNGDLHVADVLAALTDDAVVTDDETERIAGAGLGFSFDPRGDALIFARGNRIFRKPLPDGDAEEIAGPFTVDRVPARPLVVRDARILDPSGTGFSEPRDLYVDGGRIVGQGEPPQGFDVEAAVTVNASGRFAVPGLWDAHLHAANSEWLRHGVTSYRSPGSAVDVLVQEVDRDRVWGLDLPRQFGSGEVFEGFFANMGDTFNRIDDTADARRFVRQWKELGVRFIKIYRSMPWPMYRAVTEEAALQGLPVMGHGMFPEEVVRSITLGNRSVEHIGFPQVFHGDVLGLMAAAGIYWTPQYTERGQVARLRESDPEGFARGIELLGRTPREDGFPLRPSVTAGLGPWAIHSRQLRRARDLGVHILAGTDNDAGVASVHFELELFQDAGIPPWQVLRIATLEAARAEGVDAHLGTLEVGKLADLVLLDADPLEDVRNLRRPWRVVRGGRVVHVREDEGR